MRLLSCCIQHHYYHHECRPTPREAKLNTRCLVIIELCAGSGATSNVISQVCKAGFTVDNVSHTEVVIVTVDINPFLDYSEGKRRPTFQADLLGFTEKTILALKAKYPAHAEVSLSNNELDLVLFKSF